MAPKEKKSNDINEGKFNISFVLITKFPEFTNQIVLLVFFFLLLLLLCAAMATLLDYLRKTNRPYGLTDLITNLHNVVSKPMAAKALTQLEATGAITSKTYGKSVIYVVAQKPVKNEKEEIDNDNINESTEMGETEKEALVLELEARVLELSNELKANKSGRPKKPAIVNRH
jgi:hypothetical protein